MAKKGAENPISITVGEITVDTSQQDKPYLLLTKCINPLMESEKRMDTKAH